MTTVGVQYVNVQETIRHNRAMENLEGKNLEVRQGELGVKQGTLAETIRFNNISAAQQEYANQTARITAEANARNADTNAKRLSLDTYMYQDTGRALAAAQAANYQSSAMLNAARESLTNAQTKMQERQNELDLPYWERSAKQAQAASYVAQSAANNAKAETERTKTGSGLTSAIGIGISSLATLLKLGA